MHEFSGSQEDRDDSAHDERVLDRVVAFAIDREHERRGASWVKRIGVQIWSSSRRCDIFARVELVWPPEFIARVPQSTTAM